MSSELTAAGRIPGSPLRGKHEKVAHALVRGATNRQAGLDAGYKDGPGLPGSISRLRRTPAMQERMAELAEIATEDASIEDRWILEDLNFFRKATLDPFFKQDEHGQLILLDGKPQIDFARVNKEQLRWLDEFVVEKGGRLKIKLRDPMAAIDKLARHRGLLKDRAGVAVQINNGDENSIQRIEYVIVAPPNSERPDGSEGEIEAPAAGQDRGARILRRKVTSRMLTHHCPCWFPKRNQNRPLFHFKPGHFGRKPASTRFWTTLDDLGRLGRFKKPAWLLESGRVGRLGRVFPLFRI